jgi:hypothetical protein
MNDHAIDDYLLDLIRGEVERAAKADAEFATAKARREYGVCLIRSLPRDIDWRLLEASLDSRKPLSTQASNVNRRALIKRLEKRWRHEQSQLLLQTAINSKGFGR